MTVTKQDVWRVATEIDREGDKPSAIEIRRRLGSGSYTTITAALKEWQRPIEDPAAADLGPVPEEITLRMTQATADLYALVVRRTSDDFEAKQAAWQIERDALVAERQAALDLADMVAIETEACRRRIRELQEEIGTLGEDRAKAQGAAAVLQGELDRERARADQVSAELTQARAQLVTARLDLEAHTREKPSARPVGQARKAAARGVKVAPAPTAPAGAQ